MQLNYLGRCQHLRRPPYMQSKRGYKLAMVLALPLRLEPTPWFVGCRGYGTLLSLGSKPFLPNTSRNGKGPRLCNELVQQS